MKRAYFEDGCIIESRRQCDLRRDVEQTQRFYAKHGVKIRVWFAGPPANWDELSDAFPLIL